MPMNYRNSEIKIDQLVAYLNEEKINLSPAFQRGHVWGPAGRKNLLKNVLQGKPIPAVFLYKEASGSKYSYNILDGKQRLESIILYIGSKRKDFKINKWENFFFGDIYRKHVDFSAETTDGYKSFVDLEEEDVRDFREYAIPTIEITLDDASSLDEIITLFVDINQQGVAVNRFDIVKAMNKADELLKSVFDLIAIRQNRGQDLYYKMKGNEFTSVLKRLKIIESAQANNSKVDRMWERLLEVALFLRTAAHRKPVDILKGFISGPRKSPDKKLTKVELQRLRKLFQFISDLYRTTDLGESRLATDQTHFYTMMTTLGREDLLEKYSARKLKAKLMKFSGVLDGTARPGKRAARKVKAYQELSTKQTTDLSRRVERARLFSDIMDVF